MISNINDLSNNFANSQVQQSYTDLNQLNDIRTLGNEDQDAALRKIAEQFESMFMQMMIKSMRSANNVFAKDNPLNSSEVEFHKDMLDNQMSLTMSQGGHLGIADALYRQLKNNYVADGKEGESISAINDNRASAHTLPQRISGPDPYTKSTIRNENNQENPFKDMDANLLDKIKSPQDFIDAVSPYAKQIAKKLGLDYKVLVAQSALETGWGEHVIKDRYGKNSFNLFNIKADSRWDGHHVKVSTLEYKDGVAAKESANFRRYNSIEESFNNYQEFINQPRYQKALAIADDSKAFVAELQQAGYATDPHYASKISKIMDQYFE